MLAFRRIRLDHDPAIFKSQAFNVLTNPRALARTYGEGAVKSAGAAGRDIVIAVHRGLCPTGGYAIVIESVELVARTLKVRVRHVDPSPSDFVTLIPTYPSDTVILSRHCFSLRGAFRAEFSLGERKVASVPFML
ncbi:MAG: protease complex subunit PrcB family protein [Bacillota bacterium]|nr:protease complex subunit PrcB family protein [Bacillota bacterium]